jgi:hypothetical protein
VRRSRLVQRQAQHRNQPCPTSPAPPRRSPHLVTGRLLRSANGALALRVGSSAHIVCASSRCLLFPPLKIKKARWFFPVGVHTGLPRIRFVLGACASPIMCVFSSHAHTASSVFTAPFQTAHLHICTLRQGYLTGAEDYYSHQISHGLDMRLQSCPRCGPNCSVALFNEVGHYSTHLFTRRGL